MTTLIAPGPLLQLSAPLPVPRNFTLLDTAQIVPPENNRWLGGASIEDYPPGPASTHDPCASGSERVKNQAGIIANPDTSTFTVYLLGKCTAQSIGPDPTFWTDRLRLAFEAVESTAVERMLVGKDGWPMMLGPALADANMNALASGAAQNPREGLALLENEIARIGSGIIHATPAVATHWAADFLIDSRGGVQYTKANGTPVVVGAGYIGNIPTGKAAPPAGQEWAFASGAIQIIRSEYIPVPNNYSEALDRSLNDVTFIAERHYLINWVGRQDNTDPDHIQAGVLIDRTP